MAAEKNLSFYQDYLFGQSHEFREKRTMDSTSAMGAVGDSDDDEYEEVLVFVKFEDFADVNFFAESNQIVISNIEECSPKCSIDGFNFAGTHNLNLGTLMFFEKRDTEDDQLNVVLAGSSNTTIEFSLRSIPIGPGMTGRE